MHRNMALAQSTCEFWKFTKGNGVKHTLIVSYHSRWNDQEERFVQTIKQCFKAEGSNSIKQSLARVLFSYRTLPNSSKDQMPAELFLNHRLKTRLDLMPHDVGGSVLNKRSDQRSKMDKGSKERKFTIGEHCSSSKRQRIPKMP